MERVILARHGESEFSARALVNGDAAAGVRLTERGREEARRLGAEVASDGIDLAVVSEFARTAETAELALEGRDVPWIVVPDLNDPRVGEFEGGPLAAYREWAWAHGSRDEPPGAGESRWAVLGRYARGFRTVLERPERVALVVVHALPVAYALAPPAPRMGMVEHAVPYRLDAGELREAVERIEAWCAEPSW